MNEVIMSGIIEKLNRTPMSTSNQLGDIDPTVADKFASLLQTATSKPVNADSASAARENLVSVYNTLPKASSSLPQTQQDAHRLPAPFLDSLNTFSSHYHENMAVIRQGFDKTGDHEESMNGAKVLEIQYALTSTSTSIAIVSKVAGSMTNAINQLVKTQ